MDAGFRAHDVPMCPQLINGGEWQEHGGTELGDIAEWPGRACGMAALRMILLAHRRPAPPLTELLKLGAARGALTDRGWLHAGSAGSPPIWACPATPGRSPPPTCPAGWPTGR